MVIKADIFEDKCLLLDASGRVWSVRIDWEDQPVIELLERLDSASVKRAMQPALARYAGR